MASEEEEAEETRSLSSSLFCRQYTWSPSLLYMSFFSGIFMEGMMLSLQILGGRSYRVSCYFLRWPLVFLYFVHVLLSFCKALPSTARSDSMSYSKPWRLQCTPLWMCTLPWGLPNIALTPSASYSTLSLRTQLQLKLAWGSQWDGTWMMLMDGQRGESGFSKVEFKLGAWRRLASPAGL